MKAMSGLQIPSPSGDGDREMSQYELFVNDLCGGEQKPRESYFTLLVALAAMISSSQIW